MMHIVLLDADSLGTDLDLSVFQSLGTFTSYPATQDRQIVERLKSAEVAIVNKIQINRSTMEACPQLKLICISATGMNNVDLQAASEMGIAVKNVKGYSTESVAQITWGLILQLINHTEYFNQYVHSGAYAQSNMFTHFGRIYRELHTLQLGIIGLGTIGERVANIGEAFGMRIVFHSPSGKRDHPLYRKVSLDTLLATSDIVSIHTPLTPTTENLIGETELKRMPQHAILINTARGGIVNEQALAQSLKEGEIAGAGIDVFTQEPIHPENPLLQVGDTQRLILTPHIAWTSHEARKTLVAQVAENIRNFAKTKE